jgi:hypothetical protein
MAMLLTNTFMFLVIGIAVSVNVESTDADADVDNGLNVRALANAFARSDKSHEESMLAISKSLSLRKAVDIVHQSPMNTPALTKVMNMALNAQKVVQPKGYGAVDGARKMLNEMIYQSMEV